MQTNDIAPISVIYDKYIEIEYSKPLLNSKKNLSSMVLSNKEDKFTNSNKKEYKFIVERQNYMQSQPENNSQKLLESPQQKFTKHEPLSQSPNIRVVKQKKYRKAYETKLNARKGAKDLNRLRESVSQNRKKNGSQIFQNNSWVFSQDYENKFLEEMSPLQKIYACKFNNYRDGTLLDNRVVKPYLSSNTVLEGSVCNNWRMFRYKPNQERNVGMIRENNYSTNEPDKHKFKNYQNSAKAQRQRQNRSNIFSELDVANSYEFLFSETNNNQSDIQQQKIDIHQNKLNVRDSYLYEDIKISKKVISKADYSKRNNLIRRYNLSFSNASSSYINMNDNKLDNNRDDSSFLSKKIAVQSFKQTKPKRLT